MASLPSSSFSERILFNTLLKTEASSTLIESGKMTKDLALITSLKDVTVLNSEGFIKEIRKELETSL